MSILASPVQSIRRPPYSTIFKTYITSITWLSARRLWFRPTFIIRTEILSTKERGGCCSLLSFGLLMSSFSCRCSCSCISTIIVFWFVAKQELTIIKTKASARNLILQLLLSLPFKTQIIYKKKEEEKLLFLSNKKPGYNQLTKEKIKEKERDKR